MNKYTQHIINFIWSATDLDRLWIIGIFILRVFAGGTIMIAHGIPKLQEMLGGNPGLVQAVGGLGFPFPTLFAWLIVFFQVGSGLCVILGFWTRLSAIAVGFTIAYGVFSFHLVDGFYRMEAGILYSVVFLAIAVTGPGKISIDRLIRREK